MMTNRHIEYYSKHKAEINAKHRAYYSNVNSRYTRLKSKAKRLGYAFDLTLGEYILLVSTGICSYCLAPLSRTGSSIDRIDNRLGYIHRNCAPCCGMKDGKRSLSCNVRKGHLEGAGFVYPRTVELLKELIGKE